MSVQGSTLIPIDTAVWREAVELRRDFHRKPELRFEERRTAAILADRMRSIGWHVKEGIGGTGVTATWSGGGNKPHVLIRADMDALPIPDLKDVPYRSVIPGVSHSCGHDVHMSVAVAAGHLLRSEDLPGRVTFVFQPAEEIPFGEGSGARSMLEAGLLTNSSPDAILGLHCWPALPVGSIGVDRKIAMAAKDAFKLIVRGRSSHAAMPSGGRDALLGMCQIVLALHLLLRRVDSSEQTVLNIGTIKGGHSQSIIPEEIEITGTIRTVDEDVRARLKKEVQEQAEGLCMAGGLTHELIWANEMPAVVNDGRLVERLLGLGSETAGAQLVPLARPPMVVDDFALYAQRVPSLYLKLGTCGGERCPPLHNSLFDVDERAIAHGAAVITALTLDLMHAPLEDETFDGDAADDAKRQGTFAAGRP